MHFTKGIDLSDKLKSLFIYHFNNSILTEYMGSYINLSNLNFPLQTRGGNKSGPEMSHRGPLQFTNF